MYSVLSFPSVEDEGCAGQERNSGLGVITKSRFRMLHGAQRHLQNGRENSSLLTKRWSAGMGMSMSRASHRPPPTARGSDIRSLKGEGNGSEPPHTYTYTVRCVPCLSAHRTPVSRPREEPAACYKRAGVMRSGRRGHTARLNLSSCGHRPGLPCLVQESSDGGIPELACRHRRSVNRTSGCPTGGR